MRTTDRRAIPWANVAVLPAALATLLAIVIATARLGPAKPSDGSSPAVPTGPSIVSWGDPLSTCPDVATTDPSTGATTVHSDCSAAVPAPDGRRIALARNGAIVIKSLDDGTERTVATTPAGELRPTGWSPTGRYLTWSACPDGLEQRCTGGWIGAVDREEIDQRVDTGEVWWTARDTRITLHDQGGLGPENWVVGTGVGADRHVFDGDRPMWSPDGSRLAFAAPGRGDARPLDIVLADADGSGARTLATLECCVALLDWSADGRFVVVDAGESEPGLAMLAGALWLLPVEGSDTKVPWPRLIGPVARWSPDGTRFLLAGSTPGVAATSTWIVFVDGREPLDVGDDLRTTWSPDGRSLAVVGRSGGALTIASGTDGSTLRTFDRPIRGSIQELIWAP